MAKCLLRQKTYEPDAILNAVRRSLRGEAGHLSTRLDLDASVEDIIQKLDSIYGSVDKKEEVLAEFYGSRQRNDETVTSWSCRLESIIGKAVDKGLVERKQVDGMLHSMLWTGLKTSLKDISGHKYDTIKDFDGLRVALRQIESDHLHRESTKTTKPNTSKSACGQESTLNPDVEELKGMIQQLVTRMDTFETSKQQQPPWQQQQLWQQQQQSWQQQQQQPWQQQQWRQQRGRGRGRGRGQYTGRRNYTTNTNPQQKEKQGDSNKEIQCWRCGQFGHTKIGCRVRLDHSRQLNQNKPMPGERP